MPGDLRAARFARRWLMLAVFSGLLPLQAVAADWKQIDRNSQHDSLWVDLASVRREGSRVWYSERMDFGTPRTFSDGTRVKTIWTDYVVDCASRTRATLMFRGLTPAGQHIGNADPPKELKFVPDDTDPRSPNAIGFQFVCAG